MIPESGEGNVDETSREESLVAGSRDFLCFGGMARGVGSSGGEAADHFCGPAFQHTGSALVVAPRPATPWRLGCLVVQARRRRTLGARARRHFSSVASGGDLSRGLPGGACPLAERIDNVLRAAGSSRRVGGRAARLPCPLALAAFKSRNRPPELEPDPRSRSLPGRAAFSQTTPAAGDGLTKHNLASIHRYGSPVGVRRAVPSWFGRARWKKRVRPHLP